MFHTLFDPSGLSDDHLMEKLAKCREMLCYHVDRGHDSLVDSTRLILETLEYEVGRRREQQIKERNDFLDEQKHVEKNIYLGRIEGVDPKDPKLESKKERPLSVKRDRK